MSNKLSLSWKWFFDVKLKGASVAKYNQFNTCYISI